MKSSEYGLLLNKARKGKYSNFQDMVYLIRYVTRTNGKPDNDLITWGGIGVAEFTGTEGMTRQFEDVQKMHRRKGKFGRYVDHEIYSCSSVEERHIKEKKIDVDKIARKMAYDFYERDHCQVVYGAHTKDSGNDCIHIHFVINSVNFTTGNKRRENMRQTRERQDRFRQILKEEIEK